jgi:hypothetical protein
MKHFLMVDSKGYQAIHTKLEIVFYIQLVS